MPQFLTPVWVPFGTLLDDMKSAFVVIRETTRHVPDLVGASHFQIVDKLGLQTTRLKVDGKLSFEV